MNGNIQKIMGQGIRVGKCIVGLLYQVRKCGGFHLMHMLNTVERIRRNKMLEVLFWVWEIYLRGWEHLLILQRVWIQVSEPSEAHNHPLLHFYTFQNPLLTSVGTRHDMVHRQTCKTNDHIENLNKIKLNKKVLILF